MLFENSCYFTFFLLLLLFGGIGLLYFNQGDLLMFFSKNRTPYGNLFFKNATKLGEEWAFLVSIFIFLFIKFRYALLILLDAILVTIIGFLTKTFFLHPRPSIYYNELDAFKDINLVEGVYVVKGLTSFPSGHTMAGFALFTLIALFLKKKKETAVILLGIAVIIGLSRVYLVQHFLKDIYFGAILGLLIAVLTYIIQAQYPMNPKFRIDGKFRF